MLGCSVQAICRFARNIRGVSAVEFALIAPALIILYAGMAGMSQGLKAQRRTAHAAATLADLVAQKDIMTDTELGIDFAAAKVILSPFPTTGLKMRVTSIVADAQGKGTVDWSRVDGRSDAYNHGDMPILPDGLITGPNESVIMAEASYTYQPDVPYLMKDGFNFSEVYYLRPRKQVSIPYAP